jgi:hypothetical protein
MGALSACAAALHRTAALGKRRAVDTPSAQYEEQMTYSGTAAEDLVAKPATGTDFRTGTLFEHHRPQNTLRVTPLAV